MTVFLLIREDQNEHGYIDTSIAGVFHAEAAAHEQQARERERARAAGLVVEGDDEEGDADWQVSWKIEDYAVQ